MTALVAEWGLFVPLVLVLVAIVGSGNRREAISEAAFAAVATVAFVKCGALAFAHARPFVAYHILPLIPHAQDNAFPSDHAAVAGLAVAYLWTRSRVSAGIALVFALLVGAARVAAQLHWPIDIVAGETFGTMGGFTGFVVTRSLARRAAAGRIFACRTNVRSL